MTSKSSPPYSPNIVFYSLISILAVNPDLLNIASISFITTTWKNNFKNYLQFAHYKLLILMKLIEQQLELIQNNI
jgi:fucose 4-O-acetylase-like acetyltransferase